MSIREDREYLSARKADREAMNETTRQQAIDEYNKRYMEREDAIAAHEAMYDRYYEYKNNVKKTLLKEALLNIYEGSIYNIFPREKALCEALLGQYIEEVGVDQLLKNMKRSQSGILITIQEKVDEYFTKITDPASAEEISTQVIKPEDVNNFWKDIDKSEDIEDIVNTIRIRVSNAEEEFVNKNQQDKEDIKTILKDTASRVQAAKNTNDNDYSDAVEESATADAKVKIYEIQHENRHNVFDRMVRNLSEVAMTNEEAKKEFLKENGGLDMEKIVESARCMYTLLEMVGTLQLEKVDRQYIEDTLKSIK